MTDSVDCPHCAGTNRDLWEYFDGNGDETADADCGHCGKPFVLVRHFSVSYSAETKE